LRVEVGPGDLIEVGGITLLVQAALSDRRASAGNQMGKLQDLADRIARSTISVLLLGETGVGKEVFARRIHALSAQKDGPFVALNCGAFSEQLLESELFGHEAGAFTGATQTKPGLLEAAAGGTVFLDEVAEMPASAQVKLLRVLEDRQVLRVGGLRPRPIEVRFVSATNREIRTDIARGRFREDLFYRLNGIALAIPPLRERVAEIPRLAAKFIEDAAARAQVPRPGLSHDALRRLERHPWAGNIRELKNVMERAVVLCGDGPIEPDHLFADTVPDSFSVDAEELDERSRILSALQQCAGNQTRAAKLLNVSRKTLGVKMDAHKIARPQKGQSK
jgi:transcriptional regulator with PAS, ATPase and Fis domain